MTFGFFVGSRNFIRFFSVVWEDFVLHGYDCIHLCCQVLYHHGISMIVPRFTFFTENFVIRCYQVTKMFRSGNDCTSTSSARRPLLFSSSSRCHNLGPSESAFLHCAYPNPVPLLLAAPVEVHEITWKCLDFLALGFSKALLKYFHQPNSL